MIMIHTTDFTPQGKFCIRALTAMGVGLDQPARRPLVT
jgi:hypothetical protein